MNACLSSFRFHSAQCGHRTFTNNGTIKDIPSLSNVYVTQPKFHLFAKVIQNQSYSFRK